MVAILRLLGYLGIAFSAISIILTLYYRNSKMIRLHRAGNIVDFMFRYNFKYQEMMERIYISSFFIVDVCCWITGICSINNLGRNCFFESEYWIAWKNITFTTKQWHEVLFSLYLPHWGCIMNKNLILSFPSLFESI